MVTPLRRTAPVPGPDGTRALRPPRIGYADGAETRLLEILRAADDVSTTSGELLEKAETWAERYHLTPQRGVVLEFFNIPDGAKILEIGAGCGPITRHLGERGAYVDAVEPMPARAAANRERSRDLDRVEVFVGELDDVPDVPAYDVVVVVGVLEYVGNGTADRTPYLDFLRGLQRRLLDGGQLILAIENKLGVKYLAGAAEDHTNRIFDGPEGYPHQQFEGQARHGQARTFDRQALTGLLSEAGLEPGRVLGAFPDYKLTRVVLDDSIDHLDPTLAHRIPSFPSPDWIQPRPPILSERALWTSLVQAGVHWDFVNSFVVCAAKGDPSRALWPDGLLAGFASLERRPGLMSRTELRTDADGGGSYHRSFHGDGHDDRVQPVTPAPYPHVAGRELVSLMATSDDRAIGALLRRWLELVESLPVLNIDAVPHNVIVTPEDELVLIDDEFRTEGWTTDDVVARGLLWTARALAAVVPAARWDQLGTVGDLMLHLAALCDRQVDLDRLMTKEGELQAVIGSGSDAEQAAENTRALITTPLVGLGPGLSTGPGLPNVATGSEDAWAFIGDLQQVQESLQHEKDATTAVLAAGLDVVGDPATPPGPERLARDLVGERDFLHGEFAAARSDLELARAEADRLLGETARLEGELRTIRSSRAFRVIRLYRRAVGEPVRRLLRTR